MDDAARNQAGEDADDDGRARLRAAVTRRFEAGGRVFEIARDTGLSIATDPR